MVARVKKFSTGIEGQVAQKPAAVSLDNVVPDIPQAAADSVAASAPVQIRARPGNPRPRRYKNKTYSLLQEDIDLIEALLLEIRQGGQYERNRSDIVRAGVHLLQSLSLDDKIRAVQSVESLKG